ncbi:MAG: hypothetical protein IKQ59_13665 [Prevotella sp.]|nr:hypothetical protein [Prevotella sp.]
MKKTYLQPSVMVHYIGPKTIICGSQDITSDQGITYGGVDDDGTKDPASRRHRDMWEDEKELY